MNTIASAGNTVAPALLSLEKLDFVIAVERAGDTQLFRAIRGDEIYVAEDPVAVLGLVKLIELRGWSWRAGDAEIDDVLGRYGFR